MPNAQVWVTQKDRYHDTAVWWYRAGAGHLTAAGDHDGGHDRGREHAWPGQYLFDADKTTRDANIAGDIAKAGAVRKLVGDGFPLAFDANNGYSVQGAIRVGRALEALGYVWFEEPVQHYHTDSFAKIAAALDIAVAAGEQEYTLQGIKRLIEAGVDIVQPDIVKTGGFTGLSDMAALARAYGVDLVPH